MQNSQKRIFTASAIIIASISIFVYSCKKKDFSETNLQDASFNVAAAKEWWYGTFKKSASFNYLDESSPYVQISRGLISQSASNVKLQAKERLPSWKRGIAYKTGNVEVVELPLTNYFKSSLIPKVAGTTEAQYKKIAAATINKLLLVKTANGTIIKRLVTVIPTYKYASDKSFDMSQSMSLQKPDKNFEGIILVRNWNEKPITAWKVANGKKYNLQLKKKDKEIETGITCTTEWEIVGYNYYCICAPQGDEPEDACCWDESNWHEGTAIWGYVTHCEEDDNDGTPFGDCLAQGGTEADCLCQIFGYCDGGEEGNDEICLNSCAQLNADFQADIDKQYEDYILTKDTPNGIEINNETGTGNSISGSSAEIFEDVILWKVKEHMLNAWYIQAQIKYTQVNYNDIQKNINVSEFVHLRSQYVGTSYLVKTTWHEDGHIEHVYNNTTPQPIGRTHVWGVITHKMLEASLTFSIPIPRCDTCKVQGTVRTERSEAADKTYDIKFKERM